MDQHIQEYIQYLQDQRLQLELTIVDLKKQINDLNKSQEDSKLQGPTESP